jgi:hypothetical protein
MNNPVCLFIFSSLKVSHLETELQEQIKAKYGDSLSEVYFNKGL